VRGPKIWEIIVFGALAAMEFAWFTGLLFAIAKNLFWHLFLAGIAYGSGMLFLMIAILGLDVFKQLWKDMLSVVSSLIFYSGFTLFMDATNFHVLTARIIEKILSPFMKITLSIQGGQPLINAAGFATVIGPPCSGIFSMVLFTALFSFVYWLDSEKINGKKALKFYLIGLLGAFTLNLIRVAALLIIGAYWSPDIAVGLFHTNAGWILFAVYSFAFWWLTYPRMLKKSI
jgi:exosortase/archaeosortase family protein